jgi:hypothetical protein
MKLRIAVFPCKDDMTNANGIQNKSGFHFFLRKMSMTVVVKTTIVPARIRASQTFRVIVIVHL